MDAFMCSLQSALAKSTALRFCPLSVRLGMARSGEVSKRRQRLPEELLWVENPDTHQKVQVRPGELRTGDVAVGIHIPPTAGSLRGTRTSGATTGRVGTNHLKSAVATAAPNNCAAMKPPTSIGRMPLNVSVIALAKVTAGFANDVDAVNQYAAVI